MLVGTDRRKGRVARIRWMGVFFSVLGFLTTVAGARSSVALDSEERVFVGYLIHQARYYDTASRYLDELKTNHTDRDSRAEIDSFVIDILRAEGKKSDVREATEAFQKKYPNHARAALAFLEKIGDAFQEKVWSKLEQVASNPDESERSRLIDEASKLFVDGVQDPLEDLIADLDGKVQVEGRGDTQDELRRRRNSAELTRIRFMLLYAVLLPEGYEAREKTLEEGLKLADFFIEHRGYFYVMQYEALIQKGLYLLELKKFSDAGEELSILFDIDPGYDPPYTPDTVRAFKELRLKALLFGTRGLNSAGRHRGVLKAIDEYYYGLTKDAATKNPFYLGEVKSDPALGQFPALVELEYAVALAGTGKSREGLDVIHEVILRTGDDGERGEALINDARKALGRVAGMGTITLSGRDYYEAAIGLKSELKLETALGLFQKALVTLSPRDVPDYAPRCLNEIGEVNYMLNRFIESALAFQDACRYFPRSSGITKVATNFLGAATKAQGIDPDHRGVRDLQKEAKAFHDKVGSGFASLEADMARANQLIDRAAFREAGEIYARIPRQVQGEKVPFYWRAQASAVWMTYLEWEKDPSPELEKKLEEAIPRLKKIVPRALKQKDLPGAAVASLTLGQIQYHREAWADAVSALKVFLDVLADGTFVRCGALGYLALAAVKLPSGGESLAVFAYESLQKDCQDDSAFGIAALELSGYYRQKNSTAANRKKAAAYIEVYTDSAIFGEILSKETSADAKVDTLLEIARVLIDGGRVEAAQKFIDDAKKLPADEGLDRQQLYLEALILGQKRDYPAVIKMLKEYVDRFGGRGTHYEDPYVWQRLALAYYKVDGKVKKPANLVEADRAYDNARSILHSAVKVEKDTNSQIHRQYWRWCYEWMQIKFVLGDKAKSSRALREINVFLRQYKHTDMGGFKQRFQKLDKKATKTLKTRRVRRKSK